jgi:hypothetical protein
MMAMRSDRLRNSATSMPTCFIAASSESVAAIAGAVVTSSETSGWAGMRME